MASLLELAKIEANATTPLSDPPDPDAAAAHDLRLRVRFLLCEMALAYLKTTDLLLEAQSLGSPRSGHPEHG